jgi:hypothetical protein
MVEVPSTQSVEVSGSSEPPPPPHADRANKIAAPENNLNIPCLFLIEYMDSSLTDIFVQ